MYEIKVGFQILLTDDDELLRLGVRHFLEKLFKGVLMEEAQNAQQTLDFLRQKRCDLLLLDLGLPDRNGMEILPDVKRVQSEMPVIVFSGMGEEEFAVVAINAGASGFVTKTRAVQELPRAIQKVLDGDKYVSPALAEKLALGFLSKSARPLHESLSAREFQVLRLMASGQSVKTIADGFSLSVNTVSTYRARLLEKMNMHSNAELTRYALKQHIVE